MKKMQTLTGVALTALLALSVVATSGAGLAAAKDTSGSASGLVARAKTTAPTLVLPVIIQGVTWEGITWE